MLLVLSLKNSYLKDIVVFIPHLTSECSPNHRFSEEQLLADVMRRARSRTWDSPVQSLVEVLGNLWRQGGSRVCISHLVPHGVQQFWQMLLSWGWKHQLYNLGTWARSHFMPVKSRDQGRAGLPSRLAGYPTPTPTPNSVCAPGQLFSAVVRVNQAALNCELLTPSFGDFLHF